MDRSDDYPGRRGRGRGDAQGGDAPASGRDARPPADRAEAGGGLTSAEHLRRLREGLRRGFAAGGQPRRLASGDALARGRAVLETRRAVERTLEESEPVRAASSDPARRPAFRMADAEADFDRVPAPFALSGSAPGGLGVAIGDGAGEDEADSTAYRAALDRRRLAEPVEAPRARAAGEPRADAARAEVTREGEAMASRRRRRPGGRDRFDDAGADPRLDPASRDDAMGADTPPPRRGVDPLLDGSERRDDGGRRGRAGERGFEEPRFEAEDPREQLTGRGRAGAQDRFGEPGRFDGEERFESRARSGSADRRGLDGRSDPLADFAEGYDDGRREADKRGGRRSSTRVARSRGDALDGFDDADGYDDYEADRLEDAAQYDAPRRLGRGAADDAPFDARAQRRAAPGHRGPGAASGMAFSGTSPFGSLERMLAGRYLRARRQEGFISVIAVLSLIGITLGVAVLIVVMSVMNGFRAELVDRIVGVNGHLRVTSAFEVGVAPYDAVAGEIAEVDGVTLAAPMIEAASFASTPRAGVGVVVRGMRREDLMKIDGVGRARPDDADYPIGALDAFNAGNGVAIGAGLARSLGVSVGDKVDLISPKGRVTPFGTVPRRQSFEVLYVYRVGMYQFDQGVVYMPLEAAQSFFSRTNAQGLPIVDRIEVMVATPQALDAYRDDIVERVGGGYAIGDWMDQNQAFIGALNTERSVMFLILSLLILIASLIIISGLIMLVKEKGADIAILRTMGMSRSAVLRIFFLCGATIGFVGTLLGVGLGVVVALNLQTIKQFIESSFGVALFPGDVYILNELPSRLQTEDVVFTVAVALSLSFVATIYPAWRAARLDPVEALRYE